MINPKTIDYPVRANSHKNDDRKKDSHHETRTHQKDTRSENGYWQMLTQMLSRCESLINSYGWPTPLGPPLFSEAPMYKSLQEVLSYQNPAVVRRYQRDFPLNADRAEQLFDDLLRFFWASKKQSLDQKKSPHEEALDFTFIMDDEMREIDHMWHVFLLYTQDYMDFCQTYFGEYLHHLPDVVQTSPGVVREFVPNLEKFLGYVYDNLGEDVVRRWFAKSA